MYNAYLYVILQIDVCELEQYRHRAILLNGSMAGQRRYESVMAFILGDDFLETGPRCLNPRIPISIASVRGWSVDLNG
jgi:hypothetical protein